MLKLSRANLSAVALLCVGLLLFGFQNCGGQFESRKDFQSASQENVSTFEGGVSGANLASNGTGAASNLPLTSTSGALVPPGTLTSFSTDRLNSKFKPSCVSGRASTFNNGIYGFSICQTPFTNGDTLVLTDLSMFDTLVAGTMGCPSGFVSSSGTVAGNQINKSQGLCVKRENAATAKAFYKDVYSAATCNAGDKKFFNFNIWSGSAPTGQVAVFCGIPAK